MLGPIMEQLGHACIVKNMKPFVCYALTLMYSELRLFVTLLLRSANLRCLDILTIIDCAEIPI